ncbi:MAG: rod shape-determining protein MreD [Deltaproteobacteria bacterium]|nr:rod shape-determining protein MreD [Deltaproteobacteria bacterium]
MNLIGSDSFDLDVLTIFIAYLFLFYRSVPVGWFAFGQGLLIDIFSGGFHGLFTFLYLVVFGGIRLGARFFNPQGPKGQMIIIALAVLLKKALLLMVVNAFSRELVFSTYFLFSSAASAIATGMAGPILFSLLNRLRGVSFEDALSPSTDKLRAFKDESFFQ